MKSLNITAIMKASSFQELQKHIDLERTKQSIKSAETNRIAHIRYNARRNLLVQKAIELGLDKDLA